MSEQRTPLRVLHIEDSEDDALLVMAGLRRAGYAVHVNRVMDAAAMQAALQNGPWDVVLSDYSLPVFDAPAALGVLKQSGQDLPFIIVSGTINEEQAVTALQAGAQDFITKSNLARMAPAIEREMREAENRRQRRQVEARLQTTMDAMQEGAQIIGFDWRCLYVNDAAAAQVQKTKADLLGQTLLQAQPGLEHTELFATLRHCLEQHVAQRLETTVAFPDGTTRWFDLNIQPVPEGLFILSRDITKRKRAEQEVERLQRHNASILNSAGEGIYGVDLEGRTTFVNPAAAELLGYAVAELLGQHTHSLIHHTRPEGTRYPPEECPIYATFHDGSIHHVDTDVFWRKNGTSFPVAYTSSPLYDEHGQLSGAVAMFTDITERKLAEAQIQRQLEQLAALRAIDLAITGSMDLRLTLHVLLGQVLGQLGVHASDILLLDPKDHMLTFAAGRGFRSSNFQQMRLRLGEGRAGRAALERRLVMEPGLNRANPPGIRTGMLGLEKFASYFAAPLIAKGQVLGVLELFHRTELHPDPSWLEFLEALAGQAAIALENATLFDGLQRSNQDLVRAYDATIEGWSHALDLRDRETEGHSQRVTELTLQLARAMNVRDDELVHVRRGALLHDIGKMGIPDQVLLKPGQLTDDEWVSVRRHPVFAFELLSPIEFLRPALDIPYCHHEKWDGTGYPRGLKAEQIPLVARLFAIVDVWDALNSDRPYRLAWPKDQVLAHIRSLSGSHFDPHVVEAFLQLVA